jgi:type II secretory pathway component PulM
MSYTALKARFASLPPRERRALVVLGVFLFVAALVQLSWSAVDSSQELRKKLPEIERRLLKAKATEKRVEELRTKALPVQLEGEALRARCVQIATTRLPGLAAGAIVSEGSRGIAFDAVVPFAAWVEFTSTLQQDLSLRLLSADIGPSDPGRAQIKARFVLADAAP